MKHSADYTEEIGTTSSLKKWAIPNLQFPSVEYGKRETPWDLRIFLYVGGAGAPANKVNDLILRKQLGSPILSRLELVIKLHETINDRLIAGGSKFTADSTILSLRNFFKWADREGKELNLNSIQSEFLAWSDYIIQKWKIKKSINHNSAYVIVALTATILDQILDRKTSLITATRLRPPKWKHRATGLKSEKQSLAETFEFGYFLHDICDALTVNVVLKSELPIRIPLGRGGEIIEWCGYSRPKIAAYYLSQNPALLSVKEQKNRDKSIASLKAWQDNITSRSRCSVVNKRIEAELLIFIGQTGMNLAQAHKLELRKFSFSSYLNGYQVRDRKERRGGEILFEIYSEYKPHFERYLSWRRTLFPNDGSLFPLIRRHGRHFLSKPHFALRDTCKAIGIRFIPPQLLRHTRINWLLRQTGDHTLTSIMAQHSKETLMRIYEVPSQQKATSEVVNFWKTFDPIMADKTAIAPGLCNGTPTNSQEHKNIIEPDCSRPSGCFWCEHHRDIDRMDYVWAIASFRHLKTLEIARWTPPRGHKETHPAKYVIVRISEKLQWFGGSSPQRKEWLDEALARIEEGSYHPDWELLIHALED